MLRPFDELRVAPSNVEGQLAQGRPESNRGMTTSAPAGTVRPVPLHRDVESLPGRILGVIHSPRITLYAATKHPRWVSVLAVTFIVSLLSGAALFETDVGRLALIDQWERTAVAFGQDLDKAQYATIVEASRNGTAYAAISSLAGGPLLSVGLSVLLFGIFTGTLGHRASYRQVLAIVTHAGVILAMRQVIATPLNYARETLANPTPLNLLFTMLDEASPLARFFGIVDLFVIWWLIVLAIGVSILYGRPAQKVALAFIGTYIALVLMLAIVMGIAGGTS